MHLQKNLLRRSEKDRRILLSSLLATLDILSNCVCCRSHCYNMNPLFLLWTWLMCLVYSSNTLLQYNSMCVCPLHCYADFLWLSEVHSTHHVYQCIKIFWKVLNWNIRGLNDPAKWTLIFNKLERVDVR
jgi:hypothetical protein